MPTFKIGINMAGAVSAGAYTAGVLDFLTEALDEWYKAKARGELVPSHDVSIEVFSGASAGGMCAAISAAMLQDDFEHISDTSKMTTTNRLYESWVNRIDIRQLLKTEDLKTAPPILSLLDSSIINEIASYALTPGTPLPAPRPYVSPNLTLFLSLTNLRGTPYSLNGAAPGSTEESTFFFGDRIQFEVAGRGKTTTAEPRAHLLDLTRPGAPGGWDVLQTSAMATGAFPIFLAPRILNRKTAEYTPPMWESVTSAAMGTPPPISPTFPPGTPDSIQTLNVDGGMTNNDPFNYANDYLAQLQPPLPDNRAPSKSATADRAVISVAPFPTQEKFDPAYQPARSGNIFAVLGRLFSALISQSRFFGESLDKVMNGTTFNRFVIAPSDYELAIQYASAPQNQPPALQCATLSAFGGFFDRGFRAHDYALGRRNCQKFLRDSFVLPKDNVIMEAALEALDPARAEAIIQKFKRSDPGTYADSPSPAGQTPDAKAWLPIIPLCGDAVQQPIGPVPRHKMNGKDLNLIVRLVLGRAKAVTAPLIATVPSRVFRIFLQAGQPFIRFLARAPLKAALAKNLGDSYQN